MTTPLTLHDTATRLANTSIMIAGPGRSGTRILGSLFQSLEKTEYLFEPPMLYALIPQIDELPEANWKLLFETFLVEEFLLNALAGRYLNFNEHDYSYILIPKSEEEIRRRMSASHSRNDMLKSVSSHRIVLKMPDLTSHLQKMTSYYPDLTSIIMFRKPESVIGSFVRQRAYRDEFLSGPWTYPPYRRHGKFYIPSWIAEQDLDAFAAMGEVERCAYAYCRSYENLPDNGDLVVIKYDDFAVKPHSIFNALCKKFDLAYGPNTEKVLGMVKEPVKSREFSWDGVSSKMRDRVYAVAADLDKRVTRFAD